MGSVLDQEEIPGGGQGNSLQYSCLENPMDRGVHGATKSQTPLKQLSMHALLSGLLFKSPLASLSKRGCGMRLGSGKPGWAVTFRRDAGGMEQSRVCGQGGKRQAATRTNLTQNLKIHWPSSGSRASQCSSRTSGLAQFELILFGSPEMPLYFSIPDLIREECSMLRE